MNIHSPSTLPTIDYLFRAIYYRKIDLFYQCTDLSIDIHAEVCSMFFGIVHLNNTDLNTSNLYYLLFFQEFTLPGLQQKNGRTWVFLASNFTSIYRQRAMILLTDSCHLALPFPYWRPESNIIMNRLQEVVNVDVYGESSLLCNL